MKLLPNSAAILCLLFATTAKAGDAVLGAETTFESYYGTVEKCVRILPMPGGEYDKGDIKEETELCELDFYSHELALCPKIWSTSAAVVVYDISSGQFEGERRSFQELVCAGGIVARYVAEDVLGKLKFTMNQETTSGVFSTSSLLYYHLSRYFDTAIEIPVAVWRNMDSQVLLGEVASGGVYFTEGNNRTVLNNAAWHTLVDIINDPTTDVREGNYGIPEDTLTSDGDKAYGVLLDASGKSTGPELDSSVASTWSVRTYGDLQNTPEFIALASDVPLNEAITLGILGGTIGLTEEQKLAAVLSPQQVAFSMRDLSEILLMDFIMTQ